MLKGVSLISSVTLKITEQLLCVSTLMVTGDTKMNETQSADFEELMIKVVQSMGTDM